MHEGKYTKIIGVYILPSEDDLLTCQRIDEALINEQPEQCIVLGDFNVNYWNPKDHRTEQIVDSIRSYNLNDLSQNFRHKKKKPYT